jgi:acetyltransferase-like isoleucine patch superfamily enzyme
MQVIPLRHEARPEDTTYNADDVPVCSVGPYSYAYPKLVWWPETPNKLTIGKFCSIAMDCEFLLGGGHDMSSMTTYPFPEIVHFAADAATMKESYVPDSGSSRVGNDVWIGRNAIFLPGVTVGDGAVIGAGAVVAKDIEPYHVVVGNPARTVRSRFDDKEIEVLLRVRWWDWPVEMIRKNINLIMSRNVNALLQAHNANEAVGPA